MKYGVWFVRLLFAAWMIPAGVNHFYELFPQPMGSQPLSQELIVALLDSRLFDLVKLVELVAGVGVLLGLFTPLMLLICMPVSFGVFYWDAPLEGWGSTAAIYGYAVLLANVLLCLAYYRSYRSMFTLRAEPDRKRRLVLFGRIVFGALMLLYAANYLFLSLWPAPAASEPLAAQLMTSLMNSRLLDVAMVVQLVTGALILLGIMVPIALCLLMPVSVCALFWGLILDHQPLTVTMTLVAFAVNGLLMLAYLSYYKGSLERRPLALGEASENLSNYDTLYVSPKGTTQRAHYIPAMIIVLAVIAFYAVVVPSLLAIWVILTLLYPAFVLLARRIRDMGFSVWLVLVPLILMLATFANQLGYVDIDDSLSGTLKWLAYAVFAAFLVWGSSSHSRARN